MSLLVKLQHGGTRSNEASVELDLEHLGVGHLTTIEDVQIKNEVNI